MSIDKHKLIKSVFRILLLMMLLISVPFAVNATNGENNVNNHLIVVLVPYLSFDEVNELITEAKHPHLWQTGAYGAVNLKPDGSYSYLNNAVTIGAGKRAAGIQNWNSYHGEEELENTTVDKLMVQWTGSIPDSEIIHPHVKMLMEKNLSGSYQARIGWFGKSLRENGVFTYVIGNADTRKEKVRYGTLLVLDEEGYANGNLQGGVVEDSSYPHGRRMDNASILEEILYIHKGQKQSFTVVEWGDLYRLYQDEGNMNATHFSKVYKETLWRLEYLIHELTDKTDAEIWLLSPAVNSKAYKNKNQLGPLWIWSKERDTRRNLFSSTTRRHSLVSNTDLAITWAEFFIGLKSATYRDYTSGSPIQLFGEEQAGPWSYRDFKDRINEINYVFEKRGAVLSSYVSSLVVILVAVSFMIWLFKESHRWRRVAEILLLSGILSPLLFLLTGPLVHRLPALGYVFLVFLGGLALAFILKQLVPNSFSLACFLFFAGLSLDVVTGSYFIHRSFLSYDPVIGARYYGIGNEFAGVYLAAGILMASPLINNMKKGSIVWLKLLPILGLMIFVLGSSSLGANAGASLSAGVVLAYVVLQLLFKKLDWRMKSAAAIGMIFVLLTALYLLQMAQPASHIFSAYQQVFAGDWASIFQTIQRKVQMNWKIFKISYWTQLFVTSYFFIAIVLWKRQQQFLPEEKLFLINCCAVGSLVLLLLNDSGIVAAATSMFITLSVCYGWSIEEKRKSA